MSRFRGRLRTGWMTVAVSLSALLAASAFVVSHSAGVAPGIDLLLLDGGPKGACCREGVETGCWTHTEGECQALGGLYLGAGTLCEPDVCSFACVGAVGPMLVPFELAGSTEGHPPHVDPDAVDCDGVVVDGGGRWYTVVGEGRWLYLDTCLAADFDTKLFVYRGDCSSLECVHANDNACMGTRSYVSWCGRSGGTFRIFVSGNQGGSGTYTLNLVEGDICEK